MRRTPLLLPLALSFALATAAHAQLAPSPWQLRTRIIMTGSSSESEPAGYQVYSALTLEAAVRRALSNTWALELSVRPESREVDLQAIPEPIPQGSVELLPVTLTALYAPRRTAAFAPYIGAGLNATVAWEKSGELNSSDLTPEIAPALQLGADWRLSSSTALNLDLRYNPLRPALEKDGQHIADLTWDTTAIGLGLAITL